MNKFWIILLHTYISKLKTKSFIITTIITALFFAGVANVNRIIDLFEGEDEGAKIAVIDETDTIYEAFSAQVKVMDEKMIVKPFEGTIQEAEKQVKDGKFDGLLVLRMNAEGLPEATYEALQIAEQELSGTLEQALQQVKVGIAATNQGLSPEEVASIYAPVAFQKKALEENAKTAEELNQARGLVYILLFVIYFSVVMYGNMIAMEVVTEKSSRVMEILISSVSPVQQMFGKILGVALLGLTQYLFIMAVGYFSLKSSLAQMEGAFFEVFGLGDLPVATFVYAIIFFILGYFLYATMAAMLGSLVSRVEDAQQAVMPMTLLIVAAFMIAMFGLGKPDATFITVTSYFPPFTPMIMFLRVGMLNVPLWEIALSIVLMLATIVFLAIWGARVYKGGVLMYGKTSLKDMKQAIQLSKGE